MKNNDILLRTEALYCKHLSADMMPQIDSEFGFVDEQKSRGGFLERYLKQVALEDEIQNNARTYIVFSNKHRIVGYFSLKAGFVSTYERKKLFENSFDSIPGVELSNFAMNGKYVASHPYAKGLGYSILDRFVLPITKMSSEYVGSSILYLFALPHESLISLYERYGFARLAKIQERAVHKRIRPRYDKDCIFMYQWL